MTVKYEKSQVQWLYIQPLNYVSIVINILESLDKIMGITISNLVHNILKFIVNRSIGNRRYNFQRKIFR